MARRKKYNDEIAKNSGGVGYSQAALDKLNAGTYGRDIGSKRQVQYRTSQEQTQQSRQLPVLEGLTRSNDWESSFGHDKNTLNRAAQYQQNLANEAAKYTYNESLAKANTLDKKDQGYLQRLVDNFGDGDVTRDALKTSTHTKDWEKKYGKSYDEIYRDFLADQGNAKMRQGQAHPILSEISTALGSLNTPLTTIPSLIANAIAPDSKVANALEDTRSRYENQRKLLRAGVKERTGDKGDKVIDTVNAVADRMIPTIAGKAIGGNVLGGVLAGASDANRRMDELNLRPDLDNRRKALTALGQGAVEGVGTAITSGLLDKIPSVGGIGGRLLNVGKGAGNAAIENSISEAIEMGWDTFLNKENSAKELNKAIYMLNGMSEEDAAAQARKDQLGQVGSAALTGALFGGGMKGLSEIFDSVRRLPTLTDSTEPLTNDAMVDIIARDNRYKAEFTARTGIQLGDSVEDNKAIITDYLMNQAQPNRIGMNEVDPDNRVAAESAPEINNVQKIEKAIKEKDFKPITFNNPKGESYLITKSTRPGEKWQLSFISDTGNPTGHTAFRSDEDLIKEISKLKDENIRNLGTNDNVFSQASTTVGEMLENPDNYTLEDFQRVVRAYDVNADVDGATKEDIIDFMSNVVAEDPDYATASAIVNRLGDSVESSFPTEDGVIPNRTMNESVPGNPTLTSEVPPTNPPMPSDGGNVPPETDISRRYETLKKSDLFTKSEANMKMLETAKEQGAFNKDVEGRAKAQADALKEFTDDPTKAINNNLNSQWTSGKDLDTSMLVLNDALESGDQAYTNLVMLKQAQQTKQAGRILRAALDYAKRNYAGTKEGTLQEAAKFLNDKAEAILSNRKTAEQFNAIAERIMKGDLSDLSTRFNMDDVNIQNIKNALEAGAGKTDIAHMIAMYQSVGKTGISEDALQKITDIYNQIQEQNLEPNSRARANLEADAFKVLAQDIGGKRTFKEQWDAWRYLAMLGNPKTHLRNLLGNATHYMVTEAKDNIGAVMEAAIDKANKAVGGEGIDRTKSVLTSKDRGLVQAGELDADNVAYAALNDSGNKYNVKNELDRARASFNNKALSKVDELNSNLLDLEDYSALKRKYSRSLARFLKANGSDESIFKATDEASKALLEKGRAYAIDQAKQATFHEYSKVAAMLSRFSNDMANSDKLRHKAGAWMLEGVLPFKKTPINILKQGGKYSPISIATGLKKAFDAVQTGNSTAAEAIEDLSAGLTGTGIMGLGMFLAHEGFLTGSANPDYTVDQAETEQGAQNYALKIGDNSYTLDWLAPMSLPLFVGVELNKLMNEDDDEGITLNKAISALSTIAEPITEMSMLQGINDVLEKLSYDPAGALAGLATQTGLGYITQGVPTIAGQVARAADDTRRSTYSENTGAEKQLDRALMKVQNKIPFLSRSSQPYVTASGQEQKNEGLASTYLGNNFGTRLIDQMLSPGYYKQGNVTPVDEELNRLYEATGENVYKNVSSGKVNNEKLSKEKFTDYQKLYGSNTDTFYNGLVSSENYKNLDDAARVKALSDAKSISKMIADYEVGGRALKDSEQKVYDIYKKQGADGIIQYINDKQAAKSLDMSYETYVKKEAEQPGGAQAYVQEKQAAVDSGFVNKSGNADVKGYEKAMSQAGAQSQKFVNDLPMLQQTGLEKSAYYTYANAINVIPSLTPSEFAQTYNEINTNTSNAMTQKELLDYLNKYQFSDDPAEDERIANELWRAYGGWTNKAGVEKKIKLQNGQWKSYY